MGEIKMEAEIVFEPHVPHALQRALNYAGGEGFVASMPQLLHARTHASYDNIIWNTWFTSYSEESVVKSPRGNHVVVAIHGGGIFSTPERYEQVYRASVDRNNVHGFTGQYAGKISAAEARDVLQGKLADGTELPMYSFADFKNGISNLPIRYGVTIDFELARQSLRGYEDFEVLKDDPNMIIRAGGVEANIAYLDKYRDRNETKVMGHWHPYNRIDSEQAQTRMPFLAGTRGMAFSEGNDPEEWGYDCEYGLGGDACIHNMGRYIAVAPHDASTSLRDVDFES